MVMCSHAKGWSCVHTLKDGQLRDGHAKRYSTVHIVFYSYPTIHWLQDVVKNSYVLRLP